VYCVDVKKTLGRYATKLAVKAGDAAKKKLVSEAKQRLGGKEELSVSGIVGKLGRELSQAASQSVKIEDSTLTLSAKPIIGAIKHIPQSLLGSEQKRDSEDSSREDLNRMNTATRYGNVDYSELTEATSAREIEPEID